VKRNAAPEAGRPNNKATPKQIAGRRSLRGLLSWSRRELNSRSNELIFTYLIIMAMLKEPNQEPYTTQLQLTYLKITKFANK